MHTSSRYGLFIIDPRCLDLSFASEMPLVVDEPKWVLDSFDRLLHGCHGDSWIAVLGVFLRVCRLT